MTTQQKAIDSICEHLINRVGSPHIVTKNGPGFNAGRCLTDAGRAASGEYAGAPANMQGLPAGLQYLAALDEINIHQHLDIVEGKSSLCKEISYRYPDPIFTVRAVHEVTNNNGNVNIGQ